jgi:hypothetical protein
MLRAAAATVLAVSSNKHATLLSNPTLNTESMSGAYGTKLACDSPCQAAELSPSLFQCTCATSAPYTFHFSVGLNLQENFQDLNFNCNRMVLALKAEVVGNGNCYVTTLHGEYPMLADKQVHMYDIPSSPHLYCDAGTQFQSSNAYFICTEWPI